MMANGIIYFFINAVEAWEIKSVCLLMGLSKVHFPCQTKLTVGVLITFSDNSSFYMYYFKNIILHVFVINESNIVVQYI